MWQISWTQNDYDSVVYIILHCLKRQRYRLRQNQAARVAVALLNPALQFMLPLFSGSALQHQKMIHDLSYKILWTDLFQPIQLVGFCREKPCSRSRFPLGSRTSFCETGGRENDQLGLGDALSVGRKRLAADVSNEKIEAFCVNLYPNIWFIVQMVRLNPWEIWWTIVHVQIQQCPVCLLLLVAFHPHPKALFIDNVCFSELCFGARSDQSA